MFEIISVAIHKKRYEFRIEKRTTGFWVTIPGFGGSPDNGPEHPRFPEQEIWMRQHSGLKEIWHLTWECCTLEALEDFKLKVEDFQPGSTVKILKSFPPSKWDDFLKERPKDFYETYHRLKEELDQITRSF